MLLLFSAALLTGCESLVNDLDPDKFVKADPKLVVSCYISPQSAKFEAIITESQPLLGPANYYPTFVSNAVVILSDGQNRVQLMFDDSLSQYEADTSALKIVAGKTYFLTVDDGKRSVKAQCTVPVRLPEITEVTHERLLEPNYTDTTNRLQFSWKDIKGETNYYAVRGSLTTELFNLQYDPETGDYYPLKFINSQEIFWGKRTYNDINLDGITLTSPQTRFYIPSRRSITYQDKNGVTKSFFNDAKVRLLRIEVMVLDEHYYKYYRSLENNDDNPFVEPTLVYTNVEGGLGCFASFNAIGKNVIP